MMFDVDGLASWLEYSHPFHTIGETFFGLYLAETKVQGLQGNTLAECSLTFFREKLAPPENKDVQTNGETACN